ncbi:MAG: ATP-dependent metallopeptidase FtsH/Yme1/Tma family protein, partial [Porticoccaceae bacterium]|nr:ATP-dependent metallopeptidase FtsH/Yme1/Tma family protein [Porticoccaceae bacterium]
MAKNLILWLVIAVILLSVFNNLAPTGNVSELDYSEFIGQVRNGQVSEVTF